MSTQLGTDYLATNISIIPYEYQGWALLTLLLFGIVAIVYGLYLSLEEKQWNRPTRRSGK